MATHSNTLAWKIPWATIHGVTKNQTRLNDFNFILKRTQKKKKSALVLTEEEYLRKDKDGRECPVPQVGFPALLGKV